MANGMLSQEEIDALLRGEYVAAPEAQENSSPGQGGGGPAQESFLSPLSRDQEITFSDIEKDALGELANISMGTAATTLSQLLGRKVEITTPSVEIQRYAEILQQYPTPSVIAEVKYKAGIEGSNLFILTKQDGASIVDMMMGGDGLNPTSELSEIQISGIAEAMNQMMGSAATSMSAIFNSVVDISPPLLSMNDQSAKEGQEISPHEKFVRISFRMVVEGVIDSVIVQVTPLDVAKKMVNRLMGTIDTEVSAEAVSVPPSQTQPPPPPPSHQAPPPQYGSPPPPTYPPQPPHYPSPPPQGQPASPYYPPPGAPYPGYEDFGQPWREAPPPQPSYAQIHAASVQPVQFAPLKPMAQLVGQDNLELIMDVPLQVSVELGKAKKTIKEILELGQGSVIELDRLAGEPVDMIVNGKLIAKCEVVVINESFGIRITDIIQPHERMAKAYGN